jgi:hypothetical protein
MGKRIPISRVLNDLLKKHLIKTPPPGGHRWLHGLVLSGIVPAEQDPHTLRWSTDEDDLPRIAAIICDANPASPRPASERATLPAAHPRPDEPAPRAVARRRRDAIIAA